MGTSVGVMLLIYLHLQVELHSSQQSGAAEVQADLLSHESSSLQCRTDAGSWSGDCAGWAALQWGPAPGPAPLSLLPLLTATVGPSGLCQLQPALGELPPCCLSSQHCSASMDSNNLRLRGGKFWQRTRQKAGGSFYVGVLLMEIQFFQGSQKAYTGILQFCLISSANCAQQCHSFTTI